MKFFNGKYYMLVVKFALLAMPLVFFIPSQFSKDLYQSLPFWVIMGNSLLLSPIAYFQLRKSSNREIVTVFLIYLINLSVTSYLSISLYSSSAVLLLNLAYLSIYVSAGSILFSQKHKEYFSLVFLGVVTTLTSISIFNTIFRRYINLNSEGLSFMWVYWGHNHLAILLIVAIPLCVYFLLRNFKNKFLQGIFIFLLFFYIIGLFLTYARAAFASLIISSTLVVIFRPSLPHISNKKKIILIFFIVLVLVSFGVVSYNKSLSGIRSRIFHWNKGIEIFVRNPLSGQGPRTYGIMKKEERSFIPAFFAHNFIIQQAADSGLLGTIPFVILLFLILFKSVEKIKKALKRDKFFYIAIWLGILSMLLNDMTDFDLQLPAVSFLFWILAGMLL